MRKHDLEVKLDEEGEMAVSHEEFVKGIENMLVHELFPSVFEFGGQ